MTKILITGSKGQLGQSLKELAPAYPRIHFIFTDIEELDITRPEECNRIAGAEKPVFIINCAAYTSVDQAETDPGKCFSINAGAVKNLSDAAKSAGAWFIHVSTDYVFSGRQYIPYTESDIPDPESVYGLSKLKGEELIRDEPHVLIIRTSWLYSVHGQNFFKTMFRLTSEKEELKVVSDQAGTPTWAHDLASAIMEIVNAVLTDPGKFVPGIFHYSSEGLTSWYDFALEIRNMSGHHARIQPITTPEFPLPAPRPFYSVLNKKKIKEIYHIGVPHWKDSLSECLNEFKKLI